MLGESVFLVVLMGHGTYDGVDAKSNLGGPDLESRERATLLDVCKVRIVFVRQLVFSDRIVTAATVTSGLAVWLGVSRVFCRGADLGIY
jgi:hypothetical protein